MKFTFCLLLVVAMAGLTPAQNGGSAPTKPVKSPLEMRIDEAKDTYSKARGTSTEKFLAAVPVIIEAVARTARLGDQEKLEFNQSVTREAEEVGLCGTPPTLEELRTAYENHRQTMNEARKKFVTAMQALAKSAKSQKSGSLETLASTEADLFPLRELIAMPFARDIEAQISSRRPMGFDVGPVKRGERLTLTYITGKWSAGHKAIAESPDESKDTEKRLCICDAGQHAPLDIITLVRTSTKSKPYEWRAEKDYDKVTLRINDPGQTYGYNRDEGVKYRVQLRRADRTKP